MTSFPINIPASRWIPIEWYLDTDMLRHEAVNIGLLPSYYIETNTLSSQVYAYARYYVNAMASDPKTHKSRNLACLRVLASSLVKRELLIWDIERFDSFKIKMKHHLELINEMQRNNEINFTEDAIHAAAKVMEADENTQDILETWNSLMQKAIEGCNEIIRAKHAEQNDAGVWEAIINIAYERN